jgi:hypothetical protein
MTRRTNITLLATAMAAGSCVFGKDNNTMREIFETSQKDKKGLMLYVKGQTIGGVVVNIAGDSVELRSREYSRIMVKMDAIDAVAMA